MSCIDLESLKNGDFMKNLGDIFEKMSSLMKNGLLDEPNNLEIM